MQILNHCKISKGVIADKQEVLFTSEEFRLNCFLKSFYKSRGISYSKFYKMDEQCKLAFIASEVLLQNFEREKYQDEEIAMVFTNSESTLTTDMSYWESTKEIASPALFVYTLPNIMMGEIAIRNKIKGENIFFITEEYDANLLLQQTELIFMNTTTKIVVVGWVNYRNEESYDAKLFLVSNKSEEINNFTTENLDK